MSLYQGVVCSQCLELVRGGLELDTSEVSNLGCDLDIEALLGVKALWRYEPNVNCRVTVPTVPTAVPP